MYTNNGAGENQQLALSYCEHGLHCVNHEHDCHGIKGTMQLFIFACVATLVNLGMVEFFEIRIFLDNL